MKNAFPTVVFAWCVAIASCRQKKPPDPKDIKSNQDTANLSSCNPVEEDSFSLFSPREKIDPKSLNLDSVQLETIYHEGQYEEALIKADFSAKVDYILWQACKAGSDHSCTKGTTGEEQTPLPHLTQGKHTFSFWPCVEKERAQTLSPSCAKADSTNTSCFCGRKTTRIYFQKDNGASSLGNLLKQKYALSQEWLKLASSLKDFYRNESTRNQGVHSKIAQSADGVYSIHFLARFLKENYFNLAQVTQGLVEQSQKEGFALADTCYSPTTPQTPTPNHDAVNRVDANRIVDETKKEFESVDGIDSHTIGESVRATSNRKQASPLEEGEEAKVFIGTPAALLGAGIPLIVVGSYLITISIAGTSPVLAPFVPTFEDVFQAQKTQKQYKAALEELKVLLNADEFDHDQYKTKWNELYNPDPKAKEKSLFRKLASNLGWKTKTNSFYKAMNNIDKRFLMNLRKET